MGFQILTDRSTLTIGRKWSIVKLSCGTTDNPAIVHYCAISDWYENRHMPRRNYLDRYL